MSVVQTFTQQLVIEICCHENCGIRFGMDADFIRQRRNDHKYFFCPRGHEQYYSGKSNSEKLQDQINSLERQKLNLHSVIDDKNHEIQQLGYSIRAQKAAKTKILNRVKNGICPCCNRTFSNLQNHFKTKHPELLES